MRPTQTAMRGVTVLAWLTMVLLVTKCHAQGQTGPAQRSPQPKPIEGVVTAETVAEGLEHPWALAFLPDGRILVTERPGRLRIVSPTGRVSEPLGGVPRVQAQGQGGLLDVAVDPSFSENRLIYLSYAEPGEGGAGTAVTSLAVWAVIGNDDSAGTPAILAWTAWLGASGTYPITALDHTTGPDCSGGVGRRREPLRRSRSFLSSRG